MPTGLGYPSIMGAARQGTGGKWGYPVAVTDRIPWLGNDSLQELINKIEDETLIGKAGRTQLDFGTRPVSGSFNTEMRYTQKSGAFFCGTDLLLALAMGAAPTYASSFNILKLSEEITEPCTLAVQKTVSIWEFDSCFFKGFKLSGKASDHLRCSFDVNAYRLRCGTVAGTPVGFVNGTAQMAALAASGGKRVLFGDIKARIRDIAGGVLGDTYRLGVGEFTLDYNSNLSEPEFSSPDSDLAVGAAAYHGDANYPTYYTIPFVRAGKRVVGLELKLLRYSTGGIRNWATQLETWKNAGTPLAMDMVFSIDSDARNFALLMPALLITDLQSPVSGASPIATTIKCELARGASYGNTTMLDANSATIPEEFCLQIKNSADGRTAAIWT
jgi:hypothetical protein